MNPRQQNFKASIENLETLRTQYISANKTNLESTSVIQFSTPTVSPSSITTTSTVSSFVINDYVRMCCIYCIMLWTYWEAFGGSKILSVDLEELKLIRNCLVHHEGDMARYSQDSNSNFSNQGTKLISLTAGKSFVQGYNLLISEIELVNFTNLIKSEFTSQTGLSF